MTVFEARHIGVQYQRNGEPFAPFSDVSLALEGGRMYNLTGPSGSGKSTLMNLLGCLDVQTSGDYFLDGTSVRELGEKKLSQIRNKEI